MARKGQLSVQEAGRKGGLAVRNKYGRPFYQEIGHKGGQKVRQLIQKGKQSM